MLAGVAAGIALAIWGASRTRFLKISDRLYYVPHTYTGVAVSLLFLGRIVYRFIQVYTNAQAAHPVATGASSQAFLPASMLTSPLTLSLFFVLMGYYVCYYSVVLWKSKRTVPEEIGTGAPLPDTRIS
jgi:cytochrome b561